VITIEPSEPVDTVPPPASDVITIVPLESDDTAAFTPTEKVRAKAINNNFFILNPFLSPNLEYSTIRGLKHIVERINLLLIIHSSISIKELTITHPVFFSPTLIFNIFDLNKELKNQFSFFSLLISLFKPLLEETRIPRIPWYKRSTGDLKNLYVEENAVHVEENAVHVEENAVLCGRKCSTCGREK